MGTADFIKGHSIWIAVAYYIIISLTTLITYAIDKSAAEKGRWRIKESTLHILSLMGGWPGALYARRKLRHKTIKQPFRAIFWCTVALHCLAISSLVYLFKK